MRRTKALSSPLVYQHPWSAWSCQQCVWSQTNTLSHSDDTLVAEVIKKSYYASISDADMQKLLTLYPNDPAVGAPYGTGNLYEYTPMLKRIASMLGDITVDAVRRFFVQTTSAQEGSKVWSYCEWPICLRPQL